MVGRERWCDKKTMKKLEPGMKSEIMKSDIIVRQENNSNVSLTF